MSFYVLIGLYAYSWVLMGPYMSLCVFVSPNGFLLVLRRVYESLCVLLLPYASVWVLMGPY